MILTYPNSWQFWKEQTNNIQLSVRSEKKKLKKPTNTHSHLACVFDGKAYDQHSLLY